MDDILDAARLTDEGVSDQAYEPAEDDLIVHTSASLLAYIGL